MSRLTLLEDRVVWMEDRDNYTREAVVVHDLSSGTTADLTTIDRSGWAFPFVRIEDIGQTGVVIRRGEADVETLELLTYAGQTRQIDTVAPPADFNEMARCIGPYVVYPKGGRWIIYDPAEDPRRELDPFAQLPPASQPGS